MKKIESLVFVLLTIFLVSCGDDNRSYHYYGDIYQTLGDYRFAVGVYGQDKQSKNLWDMKYEYVLISNISRYVIDEPYIYIAGDYFSSYGQTFSGEDVFKYHPFDSEEEKTYSMDEIIPRYAVLNYEDVTLKLYNDLDDIPENSLHYFTDEIPFLCQFLLFGRTCYGADSIAEDL